MPEELRRRRWVLICLAAYATTVALVVLLPISYATIVQAIAEWLDTTLGVGGFGAGWIESIANVFMFLPLGLLLTLLFRRPWFGVLLALALSVAAELAQLVIPSRQPSLRDILANALGAALGAALAWLFVVRRDRREP
ncbi:VanZ family protein [Microbacterium sp. Leaf288]|uniref:VanZ family protein n=1 Tax=Microbacterium sp. Leaf288 TaxID=1736323 RepID=UPI0009EAA988|nr:VanZ family protein [Microbacterium sp. Leaf288]